MRRQGIWVSCRECRNGDYIEFDKPRRITELMALLGWEPVLDKAGVAYWVCRKCAHAIKVSQGKEPR